MPSPCQRIAEHLERIRPGFARVDHDRLPRLARQIQLSLEDLALHVARREIVMVVEPDLADGQDLGMPRQLAQTARKFPSVAFDASCG